MKAIVAEGASAILQPDTVNIAETICSTSEELSAEFLVMGTCGRSTLAWTLMGSVTEGVVRTFDRDLLAIPPLQNGAKP